MTYEINNWVFENASRLKTEITQQIREELKAIRLREGECIVCNEKKISADCFENIIKIFEKYKVQEEIKNEFMKSFGFFE